MDEKELLTRIKERQAGTPRRVFLLDTEAVKKVEDTNEEMNPGVDFVRRNFGNRAGRIQKGIWGEANHEFWNEQANNELRKRARKAYADPGGERYSSGGKVRGAGRATKGVRPCKVC